MQRAELTFQMQVDIEVIGEASRVGGPDQTPLLIHHSKWKAGAVLHQVGGRRVASQKLETRRQQACRQWRPTPHMEAVGRVPRRRTTALRTEDRALQAIVNR